MSGVRYSEAWYAKRQREADAAKVEKRAAKVVALKSGGLQFKSKAEARYAQLLEARVRCGEIKAWKYEAVTLKLADGVRYTPDFQVDEHDGRMALYEVKGHMREAARVRLLVAVSMFPGYQWWLVWSKKGEFLPEKLS